MAKSINQQEVLAWVRLSQELAVLGINAAAGIKRAIKAMRPDVSNEELDEITKQVIADAERRKGMAQNDAAGRGPQPAAEGRSGKLGPTGQPQPFQSPSPLASPPSGAGPTGTDGITGTATANEAPPAPGGKDGLHSHADRPSGGLPGTASALPAGNSPFAAEADKAPSSAKESGDDKK